jgi:hypothetical protein
MTSHLTALDDDVACRTQQLELPSSSTIDTSGCHIHVVVITLHISWVRRSPACFVSADTVPQPLCLPDNVL